MFSVASSPLCVSSSPQSISPSNDSTSSKSVSSVLRATPLGPAGEPLDPPSSETTAFDVSAAFPA